MRTVPPKLLVRTRLTRLAHHLGSAPLTARQGATWSWTAVCLRTVPPKLQMHSRLTWLARRLGSAPLTARQCATWRAVCMLCKITESVHDVYTCL